MNVIAGAAVGVVMLPVLLITAAAAVLASVFGGGGGSGRSYVLPVAANDIPEHMKALYEGAASVYRISWPLLAAVGKVECDHNRLEDASGELLCARPNAAGAVGPMQFLPSTFAAYAPLIPPASPPVDPPRPPSIVDEHDSIYAAAAKLSSDGLAADPWRALWSYNHSDTYVATVLAWAVRYGWMSDNRELLGKATLVHPRLQLREDSRADVTAGRVAPRVLAMLLTIGTGHRVAGIGPFTRHHCLVNGTSHLSNHVYGRAVDLFTIDGAAVTTSNPAARAVVTELLALPAPLIPDEIGQPWSDLAARPGVFTDSDHQDHLHLGFETSTGANAQIQTPECQ